MSLIRTISAVLQIESEDTEQNTTMKTKGPNVMAVELSAGLYAAALSFVSQCENAGRSPSGYLAYTFACYQMAHLAGDMVRARQQKSTIPTHFVLTEGKIAFGLLAITNMLEGNTLSLMLAAEGIFASMTVSAIYNNEGSVKSFNAMCDGVKQQSVNMFNGVINFFQRKPQLVQEREIDVALAMKKTN